MLPTIGLDNEPLTHAYEVREVRSDRHLTSKFETLEAPVAEGIPQLAFSICLVTAENARALDGHRPNLEVPTLPRQPLTLTLSHKGRGNGSLPGSDIHA